MATELPFAEVLDAVDHLSAEEQEMLVSITRRRLAERGRKRIGSDIEEARREFADGRCRTTTVDELWGEIMS